VRKLHAVDLTRGAGWEALPLALARKYPRAGRELRLAMGLSGHADLRPRRHGTAPAPSARVGPTTSGEARPPRCRHREACVVLHLATPSRPISSRTATAFVSSRSSSGTATSARR
jgi:hypothetical protein